MLTILNKTSHVILTEDFDLLYQLIMGQFELMDKNVTLIFVEDNEMKDLNNLYRKKNESTDVLSFFYDDPSFPTNNNILGEIIISIDTAIRNSLNYKVNLNDELIKLFIHGFLHLLGFDHENNKDYLRMKKMEDLIGNKFINAQKK